MESSLLLSFYKRKYDWLLYTLLFSVLGCISYFFMVGYTDIPHHFFSSLISIKAFTVVVLVFNIFGHVFLYVNERIGIESISFPRKRIKITAYILIVGILLFLLNYLMMVCLKWITGLADPLILQTRGMRMLFIVWLIQIIMVGQIIINKFYRQLAHLYQQTSDLENKATQAKYQALQNQLNPHFLFNSLNALVSEIEYNPKNAALFTHHLSDVYRYILQNNDHQLISLRSELDFLQSYIFLHQVRLGDCIHIRNQVDPGKYEMKVPPLTLQLLVENVIKHNVINTAKPMVIDISINESGNTLTISNSMRIKKVLTPSGKGLQNLSERYQLLCGRDIEIQTGNAYFSVKVPLLNE